MVYWRIAEVEFYDWWLEAHLPSFSGYCAGNTAPAITRLTLHLTYLVCTRLSFCTTGAQTTRRPAETLQPSHREQLVQVGWKQGSLGAS